MTFFICESGNLDGVVPSIDIYQIGQSLTLYVTIKTPPSSLTVQPSNTQTPSNLQSQTLSSNSKIKEDIAIISYLVGELSSHEGFAEFCKQNSQTRMPFNIGCS